MQMKKYYYIFSHIKKENEICRGRYLSMSGEKNMLKTTLLEYYTKIQTFRLVLNRTRI